MRPKSHSSSVALDLRRQAEERLQTQTVLGTTPPPALDAQRILHELQVHQIELEMQNNTLREALTNAEAGQRFIDLYEFSPVAYLSITNDSSIQLHNRAASLLLGVEPAKLKGKRLAAYVATDLLPAFNSFLAKAFASEGIEICESVLLAKNTDRAVDVRIEAVTDHARLVCNLAVTDITERKQMEDQIRQLAFHDHLTDLPNRRLLNDRLSQAITSSKRSKQIGALIFLDLDNFKQLNDSHGHEVGDLLLTEAASRLKHCVRTMDTVARFGGDEFVVMIPDLDMDQGKSALKAGFVAEKIRAALAEPYVLTYMASQGTMTTVEHHCSTSFGVVLFDDQATSPNEIIKQADVAMYQSKETGRNRITFYCPNPAP